MALLDASQSGGQQFIDPPAPQEIFTGLLVLDSFSIVMRGLLMLFAVLFVTFTRISGVPNDDDATEFYVMILGATIGPVHHGLGQSRLDGLAGH